MYSLNAKFHRNPSGNLRSSHALHAKKEYDPTAKARVTRTVTPSQCFLQTSERLCQPVAPGTRAPDWSRLQVRHWNVGRAPPLPIPGPKPRTLAAGWETEH